MRFDRVKGCVVKERCMNEHLYFARYFFKQRQNAKFIVNWHHKVMCNVIDDVIKGRIKNLLITVPPGSSKTEIVAINLMARGLALNPRARFLHLSYSDDLALLNSQTARNIVTSDEFQDMWPMAIAGDTKSKKRWNVIVDGKIGGGVYATSLSGQVTGFRAGHMSEEWNGAIIIDDPIKPEDAFSKTKLEQANRRLLTTVKSRRAHPSTPIILIMQRISEMDPVGFIETGAMGGDWKHIKIPAVLSSQDMKMYSTRYYDDIDHSIRDEQGRFSYWEFKEPIADLNQMEVGNGKDQAGNRISRQVFSAQYQQDPVALGGNIIKGKDFVRYKILPPIVKYRMIYVDTAQKTKEHNDYSVFGCWGAGADGRIYLIDQIRGKWEAPDLQKRAMAFWAKHKPIVDSNTGSLRKMKVEDKSSGTGLIQTLKVGDAQTKRDPIPIEGIERHKDKYTRVMDALPYIEAGMVCIPEDASFTNDFVAECEAFTADETHAFDDQVDVLCDAVEDMLGTGNKIKVWENLK